MSLGKWLNRMIDKLLGEDAQDYIGQESTRAGFRRPVDDSALRTALHLRESRGRPLMDSGADYTGHNWIMPDPGPSHKDPQSFEEFARQVAPGRDDEFCSKLSKAMGKLNKVLMEVPPGLKVELHTDWVEAVGEKGAFNAYHISATVGREVK